MKWTVLGWLVALLVGATFTLAALMSRPAAALPTEGTWTLTLNTAAMATCLSRRTFELPTTRIIVPTVYTGRLLVSGDTLRFREDLFTRIPGTSRFSGTLTLGDGTQAPIQLSLVTNSRMTGQIVTGYRVDTTRCSQTITLTLERSS